MAEENACRMIKGEKDAMIPLQICTTEGKNFDNSSKDGRRNLIAKSKNTKQRELPRYAKKRTAKQTCKVKQRNKKDEKKENISNVRLSFSKDEYKYQIQKLSLMLKQSPNYPILTQNELCMLYAKYKSDGHYRSNENLPPFTSFSADAQNASNANTQFYNHLPHTETVDPRSDSDLIAPTCCNNLHENQYATNAAKFVETNLKYDLLSCPETRENTSDNRLANNKYLYADQNFATTSDYNYNHALTNHNVQAHDSVDILGDVQNLVQAKASNLSADKIANTEKNYYACNLMNAPSLIAEDYQSYKYATKNVRLNVPDFSPHCQYENLNANNENEIVQQNDASQINNFALNANFYNDLHFNKWNNAAVIAKSSSYQPLKNVQSVSIPLATNLESFYAVTQGNFNLPIHTDAYSSMGNKNLGYIASNDVNNAQQDINAYAGNSVAMLDNVYSETNAFFSSYSSFFDQYNN